MGVQQQTDTLQGITPIDIEAHPREFNPDLDVDTMANATLTGVKKKMVTEWHRFDKILISVGIFFINFITALDSSATATIQPRVLSDFNAMTRAGVISTVTYLLIAGVRPMFAKISDVFGHLQALTLSMALHTLGFLICALAHSFSAVFGGTVVSVLGQAGYGTLVAIIIADILPIHLRASVTAYVSVPNVTNYYLGVEVGNGLYERWHWVYGILCILAVVCSVPAIFSLFRLDRRARHILRNLTVTEVNKSKRPLLHRFLGVLMELDVPGLILLCGGFIAILAPLGMQYNITYGWSSARIIAPLVIGVCALLFFVYYEYKLATYPVVPFRLFKIRTFTCAILAATCFYFTNNVSLFYFNPYIQVTRETSSRTAMLLQLGTVGYNVGMFFGGWAMQFSRRYRRWAWIGWAMWLIAVCLMIRTRSGSGTTNAEIAVVQAILGIGSGVVIGCVGIGVQASVSKIDLSIAITLYGMVAYIGGVIGEGTSTTIWVNVLPSKLEGKVNSSVDIYSAINNITYFFELEKDQRVIVQNGYIETQRILTICGICGMLLAGIAMLGLAPYQLSTDDKGDIIVDDPGKPVSTLISDTQDTDNANSTSSNTKITNIITRLHPRQLAQRLGGSKN
ncbi:MFS general substrate transporter [Coemansia reversa NRRL 1564]|uniref:MFS general substrate transporter n=1 Tax=Coemansia reversa (strain ATCC 12441 / NRRL 1564) TaxID=763665 RepID=A0A2G5B3B3_COERN|nr:MFS general substrate transporter [Coemansia reversa NRRL 1564]|eukprot:PIA13509.1 MFS general substrate transporter [Coemansia reversa NRRL 1564]